MKVLVYPHDLDMGGSQLSAIELAAAVRDLGHEVNVYGRPGILCSRIEELGLTFIEGPAPTRRPSPGVVGDLRSRLRSGRYDVVHGYEWPPALEARLACLGSRTACVGTVMSMAVAPFIPFNLPLVVGTAQIADVERRAGRSDLRVIEPPVDVVHNRPDPTRDLHAFRTAHGVPEGRHVVCVTRLAAQLKLEGLLTAISVVPDLGDDVVLTIVGDGPAHDPVMQAADEANDARGRQAVVLTGELEDPRPAYAMADVVLGMGGSALRAMAFAKPVVVQGESGYWHTLTPETLATFQWTGWYGVGEGEDAGPDRLRVELTTLLSDAHLRATLGAFSRETVTSAYSLDAAAQTQVDVYEGAVRRHAGHGVRVVDDGRALSGLVAYKVGRLASRLHGESVADDFNARPVAMTDRTAHRRVGPTEPQPARGG